MTEEERNWIDVILGLYSDLPLSTGVKRHTDQNDKKRKRIMDYLEKMKEYSYLCFTHRNSRFEHLYKHIFYYKNYVIKPEMIPNSYYDLQLRVQRENGMKVELLTKEKKELLARRIVDDQRFSLNEWINYFVHGNGRFFPIYEQYWAFQGLQKLGKYDNETGKFSKRNKNTAYPFPVLNEAALEMTLTLMEKYVKNKTVVPGLEDAFHSYNFKALYEYSLKEVLEKSRNSTTEGIWKKYDMGSDYNILLNDVRGKYTGWCVERNSWAEKYLAETDFYIFYTKDIYGNYTDPRIAIRAYNDDIKEIRGIASSQNIESNMVSILNEKLKEFKSSEDFFEREKDMQMLTLIEEKNHDGIQLTKEELIFLYELDGLIEGFGGNRDPRISEIIQTRDVMNDLIFLFDVSPDEIAFDISQVTDKTKIYFGDLCYEKMDDGVILKNDDYDDDYLFLDNVDIPPYIIGEATIRNCDDNLKLPEIVTGSLSVFCVKRMKELVLPQVGAHLSVYGLERARQIIFAEKEGYDLNLYNLIDCNKIHFPESIKGNLDLRKVLFAADMTMPKKVGGDVYLTSLISANNVILPEVIGENLYIENLINFSGEFPKTIYGRAYSYNYSFEDIEQRRPLL